MEIVVDGVGVLDVVVAFGVVTAFGFGEEASNVGYSEVGEQFVLGGFVGLHFFGKSVAGLLSFEVKIEAMAYACDIQNKLS